VARTLVARRLDDRARRTADAGLHLPCRPTCGAPGRSPTTAASCWPRWSCCPCQPRLAHDPIDLTRERHSHPPEADAVAESLTRDVQLTYFYHAADQKPRRAKTLVEILGRRHPRFTSRPSIRQAPRARRDLWHPLYNAAILEADAGASRSWGTDEATSPRHPPPPAPAATTVCLPRGTRRVSLRQLRVPHSRRDPASHTHGDKASAVTQMPGHGAGRMRRRSKVWASETRRDHPRHPHEHSGRLRRRRRRQPRRTYLPAESDVLARVPGAGRPALLMYDLLRCRAASRPLARPARGRSSAVVVDPWITTRPT